MLPLLVDGAGILQIVVYFFPLFVRQRILGKQTSTTNENIETIPDTLEQLYKPHALTQCNKHCDRNRVMHMMHHEQMFIV